jgi:Rrf2 family protein
MISQTAEYALRAIVCLADRTEGPMTTQDIASRTLVPAGYLSKVLQALGRAGLVVSQRGLHGGFSLGRDAKEITVLDVLAAVDPLRRIRECPLGLRSHGADLCPLHRRLDSATALVEQAFRDSTIAELVEEPAASRPLRETPADAGTPPAGLSLSAEVRSPHDGRGTHGGLCQE